MFQPPWQFPPGLLRSLLCCAEGLTPWRSGSWSMWMRMVMSTPWPPRLVPCRVLGKQLHICRVQSPPEAGPRLWESPIADVELKLKKSRRMLKPLRQSLHPDPLACSSLRLTRKSRLGALLTLGFSRPPTTLLLLGSPHHQDRPHPRSQEGLGSHTGGGVVLPLSVKYNCVIIEIVRSSIFFFIPILSQPLFEAWLVSLEEICQPPSTPLGPSQLSHWDTRGQGCSHPRCSSKQCCPWWQRRWCTRCAPSTCPTLSPLCFSHPPPNSQSSTPSNVKFKMFKHLNLNIVLHLHEPVLAASDNDSLGRTKNNGIHWTIVPTESSAVPDPCGSSFLIPHHHYLHNYTKPKYLIWLRTAANLWKP